MTITVQQRRLACVLDPALILSPYGLMLSRLGDVLDLWVGRELWHMLDNTHFYRQHPTLLGEAMPSCTDTPLASQEVLQALLAWEQWRLEHDQAGLKLFWIGDDPSGSLLPAHIDTRMVWRYEMLAAALEQGTSQQGSPEPILAPAFRDTVALAAALGTSCILTRPSLLALSEPQLPLLCRLLKEWGVPCTPLPDQDPFVRLERDMLRHLLMQAGLAPLLWAGLQLAVVHVWVPGASTLWPEPRQTSFDGLEELLPPTASTVTPQALLWQAAQGFWYLL